MDCFHNTDVLQQSENDLFALRIKKTAVCFFQSIYTRVFQLKNVPKKGLDTKEYSVLLLFSFLTLNIKSELFCCYWFVFSCYTSVSIDFTLYLWFVYLIKSSLVHITDKIYWWLTYSYLYFFKEYLWVNYL